MIKIKIKNNKKYFLNINLFFQILILILILISNNKLFSNKNSCVTKSIFIPRSVGSNLERETFALDDKMHAEQYCENLIIPSFVFQYEKSFDAKKIAKNLFGSNTLKFVGSQVQSRNNSGTAGCCDLIADYFGLSINSNTTVKLKPVIQNFIWDIEIYLGLDKYVKGLYLKFNGPITYSSWDLFSNNCSPCSSILTSTILDQTVFPPCYMSTGTVLPTTNIVDALSGITNFTDGWSFGKFRFCPEQKFELADIDIIIGYDFFRSDCNHLGIFGQLVAPTNKRPNPEFVFAPVIGDHHWKLGGGLTAHHKIFEDACQWWGVYFETNILHFLSDNQLRSFDFITSQSGLCCNNNLSRYMLLKEFTSNGQVYSSLNNIISAINFTTRKINIKLNVEFEATLKFSCHHNCWVFDVGYDFYAKSKEKGTFNSCCSSDSACNSCDNIFDGRYFGFKGTEGICCSSYNITTTYPVRTITIPLNTGETLNSTQSKATMCKVLGSNFDDNPVAQETTPLPLNGSAVACLTWNSKTTSGLTYTNNTGVVNPSGVIVAQQSVPPVVFTNINNNILNKESGLVNSQITQKIFIHVNHEWQNCWQPYFGLGLDAEFGISSKNCKIFGLSKWSIMAKTGISF